MNTKCQNNNVDQSVPCILIIDDDIDDQALLKGAFDQIAGNFSLHFAGNAQEAIEYLQQAQDQHLPQLIVTDYHLPRYNGLRLIQQLDGIERYQGIKKVILSNSLRFPGWDKNQSQVGRCFAKPDSFHEMKHLAEQLLQMCPNEAM